MFLRIPLRRKELQINLDFVGPISRTTKTNPKTGKIRRVYGRRDFIMYFRMDWTAGRGLCVDRQLKVWPLRFTLMTKGYGLGQLAAKSSFKE